MRVASSAILRPDRIGPCGRMRGRVDRDARPGICAVHQRAVGGGDPPFESERRRAPSSSPCWPWASRRRRGRRPAERQLRRHALARRRRVAVVPAPSQGPPASGSSPSGEPSAAPEPQPSGEHRAVRLALADARRRRPVTVPAPLTGMPVKPAIARRRVMVVMVDDQFDARPQSGLSRRRRRVAGARRGRHPALHGVLPDRRSARGRTRPQLAPVLHRLGVRVAPAVRARRRLAAGEGAPRLVEGPRLLRLQRGRVPLGRRRRYLWRIHTRVAPHNVYTDGKHLRRLAKRVGADPVAGQKPAWTFADPPRSSSGPVGGGHRRPYLANKISYKLQPRQQHATAAR